MCKYVRHQCGQKVFYWCSLLVKKMFIFSNNIENISLSWNWFKMTWIDTIKYFPKNKGWLFWLVNLVSVFSTLCVIHFFQFHRFICCPSLSRILLQLLEKKTHQQQIESQLRRKDDRTGYKFQNIYSIAFYLCLFEWLQWKWCQMLRYRHVFVFIHSYLVQCICSMYTVQ